MQQVLQETSGGATPPLKFFNFSFDLTTGPLPPSVSCPSPADEKVKRCSQFEVIPFSPAAWLFAVFVWDKCQQSTVLELSNG